ncbi:MAG: hypothetical protein ACLQCU_00430 [Acidimicrobiales bacterium]|jgi:hypothetical protein
MAGAEASTDAMGDGGVLDAAQSVVEGFEADSGVGQLTLGPLVPVGALRAPSSYVPLGVALQFSAIDDQRGRA